MQIFIVDNDAAGERLDIFLCSKMKEFSRTHIQKLIADTQVTVNNKIAKANYKIQPADQIHVTVPAAKTCDITAENIPLEILFEDNDVIVINKARGMVVHPAAGNVAGTLVNALLKHCNDLSGINGEIRPGIVHRLDKDTSGVMVIAKTDQAHIGLAEQIKSRTASRRYIAIVHGNITEDAGVIRAPIGRNPLDRKKMAVTFANSKEAVTNFSVIERFGNYTLVECKLLTGRTHQIRVHMLYIGHPVVGDPKYGPKNSHFPIIGQALHSKELTFYHPISGEKLIFTAPIPQDMSEIINHLTRVK